MSDTPALYELNSTVEALATAIPALPKPEQACQQANLAWHQRERNSAWALQLAELAEQGLQNLPEDQALRTALRLQLTRIDVRRLRNEPAADQALALSIRQAAELAADWTICADTCWVLSQLASGNGDMPGCCAWLEQGVEDAGRAQDKTRCWTLECFLARYTGLLDRQGAEQRWGDSFGKCDPDLPAPARAISQLYQAYRALRAGRLSEAAQGFSTCIEALLQSGYIREAIAAQANLGATFNDLNDPDAALKWMEIGLDLARAHGWPSSIAVCQMQLGETLRLVGRLDLAEEQLSAARNCFSTWPSSRNYAVSLGYLGWLALDRGQPQEASALFTELQALAGVSDLQLTAQRGQSQALLQLGQLAEAEQFAQLALQHACLHAAGEHEIELRILLARIAQHRGADTAGTSLHQLELAHQRVQSIAVYKGRTELLNALAQAYADAGRYREAFETSQLAANARAQSLSRESANRLESIQLRNLSESARAQAEHLQQLAEAERQKAALMQRNNATLEKLGLIGQQLTRHLDMASVFAALSRHIPALLDARAFEVYLLDEDGQGLQSMFGLEDGEPIPASHIALDAPSSNAARCARERTELSIQLAPDGSDPSQVPGTMRTLSALFAPLLIGERLLGVVTVQSPQADAYGEHERMVFRTLNAYAAIALDNARAYRHLQLAQSQLLAQEKLAALGALVAGIAHELNTPLGNSLLMASTLEQRTVEVERAAVSKVLRRSELESYFSEAKAMTRLITLGLENAARLIGSFKQVAVDRTAEQRRPFDLALLCEQVAATMQAGMRKRGHRLVLDIPADILLDSFPGPFGQILSNLIENAMVHGFGERREGEMRLSAKLLLGERVELRFQDDGSGINAAHAARIFEPFFTTKFGQGGSGLGLSVSHNIASSLLGGSLTLDGKVSTGTCFVLTLPLRAPQVEAEQAQESGGQV
ncbi:GAF domain-containing protein [Paucibacter sp. B2R-40]|uniref:ATP-binding protein n=1 Tax=Paucibacter sp. B2R-40 TaxID=2893554 RepID=UPI0021E3AF66|nr:ATP-binding protein [Paucibacter sp. B2R-40]MCV2352867.1 GAF domain-containing protein [Paucibacter sp. B2R-40]